MMRHYALPFLPDVEIAARVSPGFSFPLGFSSRRAAGYGAMMGTIGQAHDAKAALIIYIL